VRRPFGFVGMVAVALACALFVPAAFAETTPHTQPTDLISALWTSSRWVGFHVPKASIEPAHLSELEAKTGIHAAVSNYFQCIAVPFSAEQATNVSQCGAIPLLTLEMWDPGKGSEQPAYSLDAINNGDFDVELEAYAAAALAYGKPLWIRPFHEMNGNWYPWGGTVNGNTPAELVLAWRRVHDIFKTAPNVQLVWCPNIDSIDGQGRVNTDANAISRYWPGAEYVDYMALDGYNFGEGDGQHWRTFSQLFADPYEEISALSSTTPLFIAETGCATLGGNKSAWIADMFAVTPRSFPRVEGIGWFNAYKSRDWRIDSPAPGLDAFRGGVSGGEWAVTQRIGNWKSPSVLRLRAGQRSSRAGQPITLVVQLEPRGIADRVRIEVRAPGSARWVVVSAALPREDAAAWSCRYTPRTPGRYQFRARFAGDAMRAPAVAVASRAVAR